MNTATDRNRSAEPLPRHEVVCTIPEGYADFLDYLLNAGEDD